MAGETQTEAAAGLKCAALLDELTDTHCCAPAATLYGGVPICTSCSRAIAEQNRWRGREYSLDWWEARKFGERFAL